MWPVSPALRRWHDALFAQDAHERVCEPCRRRGTPQCAEGRTLQNTARMMHEAWVIDECAGRAVA